jgi:hypothetical protein
VIRPAIPGRLAALLTAAAAVVIVLLEWPIPALVPEVGLDASWRIGLHVAALRSFDYGHDILFTYGPFGFLSAPLFVSTWTGFASFAYAALGQVVLAVVVICASRRVYPFPLAVVLAFLALGLPLLTSDLIVYLALFGAAWAIERDERPGQRWLVPLAGFLAAFELLVKLNGGVVAYVLFALAAWRARPGGARSEALLFGSFAVSLCVLWMATGNPLTGLPRWLHESEWVVSGYTGAMALEVPGRQREYIVAGLLVLLGAAALLLSTRGDRLRRRILLLAIAGAYAYAYVKEGFVRHDGHDLVFFGAVGVAALAFRWRGVARWAGPLLIAGAIVGVVLTPETSARTVYRPLHSLHVAAGQLHFVASPTRRRDALASARGTARAALAVDTSTLSALRGRTVDVVPSELSATWAYGLRWRPEPLLQWYLAFDAKLDRFNADALVAIGAERVLRERVGAVDGKVPEFEAPATYLALICHYREVHETTTWEVLARTRDRCSPPRRLSSVLGRAGESVDVPRGREGEIVYASIAIRTPLLQAFGDAAFKPLELPRVKLDGRQDYRFVPGVAPGPLVLHLPPSAGISLQFGGTVDYRTLELTHVASPFHIDFSAVRIRGKARVAQALRHHGRLDVGSLTLDGRRIPIVGGATQGTVDAGAAASGQADVRGWAIDRAARRPASSVVVFSDGRLLAAVRPGQARPDVARALGAPAALQSGFEVLFALPHGGHGVRVFAVAGGRASELDYGSGYALR